MTDAPERAGTTRRILAVAAVALLLAAVAGAWLDWEWWEPYNGIVITLGAIGLAIVAAIALAFRRPLATMIGATIGAVAVGLLLGQNLGPARELPVSSDGTMTIRLVSPTVVEATTRVTCSSTSDARNLWVSTDGDVRLGEDRELAILPSFAMGDLWDASYERDDGLEVTLHSIDTGPIADDGVPTELVMVSDPSSSLVAELDGLAGTVEFDGLIRNERYETGVGQADPIDFAGTIEFSCDAPSARR